MANEWDPAAPLGWFIHGNVRRPHTYPNPVWYEDVDFYTRTDPNAFWWFEGRFQNHRQQQQQQQQPQQQPQLLPLPLPLPPSPPPAPPHNTQPASAPLLVASAAAPQPPQQQQQQQQQPQPQTQPQQRPPPIFPPPAAGQVFIRNDRVFGCLLCAWTGDRRRLVDVHFLNRHQGVTAQENVNWTDWGSIRPRYR